MYKKNSIALKSNGIVLYATYAKLSSLLAQLLFRFNGNCTSLKNKEQIKMLEDNKMPLLMIISTNIKETGQH